METLQALVEQYALMREHIENEELKLKPYKDALDNLKAAVLAKMSVEGAESGKTAFGTVSKVTRSAARIVDGDAFKRFVLENEALEFLTKSIVVEPVLQYIDANGGELPPGIELNSVATLRFTKSKK